MSTVFDTLPRLYLTPEDEPDEGGRVPLLVDLAHLHIVPPIAPSNVVSIPIQSLPVSLNATAALHQLTHQESPMRRYDYDAHIHEVAGTSGIGRPLPERERGYLRGVALEAAAGALICAVLLAIVTAIVKGGWPL